SISPDTTLIVNAVGVSFGGMSVSIDDGTPSWLQWFDTLFGQTTQIGTAIQASTQNLLGNQQLLGKFQDALNALLGTSHSPASSMSRSRLREMAIEHGLPETAHPYGLVRIEAGESDTLRFVQHFRQPSPLGVKADWVVECTVATTPDGAASQIALTHT